MIWHKTQPDYRYGRTAMLEGMKEETKHTDYTPQLLNSRWRGNKEGEECLQLRIIHSPLREGTHTKSSVALEKGGIWIYVITVNTCICVRRAIVHAPV